MMQPEDLVRAVPLTESALVQPRKEAVAFSTEMGRTVSKFTCDECGARHTCTLVFDLYNTNGDCLAEK